MFKQILKFIAGDPNKKDIDRYSKIVAEINGLEPQFRAFSDEALRAKTDEFKQQIATAVSGVGDEKQRREAEQAALNEILPEAFAAVREAAMRTLGQRHYDVQLIGGMILNEGKIAEMRTGEGKTLVSTLPIYLNSLLGHGVHLITVNDYLARRDARWMAPIYHLLGLTIGVLQEAHRTQNATQAFLVDLAKESAQEDQHQLQLVPRKEAYAADITYGTNNEFGFDYLRDNMAMTLEGRVQRERYYAIVDEVDNILIDEARTPLIISGPSQEDPKLYTECARIVKQLKPEHFEIDERNRSIALNELGEAAIERLLGQPLRDPDRPEEVTPEQARLLGHIEQALRAEFLFKNNKDYVVQNKKIIIVDEFTGRMMPGRRWSDGLHQAVEAKEGVPVQQDNVTYATITLQNYFRLYAKLAGMTGTALTEAEEFDRIYKLAVLSVPPNLEYMATRPDSTLLEAEVKEDGQRFTYFAKKGDAEKKPVFWRRKDYPDLVFRTEEAKLRSAITEMLRRHLYGQPLLIGTTSVEASEHLSERLRPEPLQRLAMVLLIRHAWFEKNNKEEDGILVPELQPLADAPLDKLNRTDLQKQMRDLGLSTNPAGEDNLKRLLRILELGEEYTETLIKVLQGGIKHNVLNAKKHDEESRIIADAGALGAVTIATNMAGRGVDIKLGGEMAEEVVTAVNRVLRRNGIDDPYDFTNDERREKLRLIPESEWGLYEGECKLFLQMMEDSERVRVVGGLHVVGSERHEARRIDNQLRGRAARQGDAGSSQFFLSLEDELMRRFGGQGVSDLMQRLRIDDSVPIAAGIVNRTIEQAQTRVEGSNFDIRKHLIEYDDVLNAQRNSIYTQRDRVFSKADLTDDFDEMLTAEVVRRVELNAAADDRWKLFAWLDEIQPPIVLAEDEIYPTYTQEILLREIGDEADKRAALLELARDAIKAERTHLMEAIETQIERAEERLGDQVKEKRRLAEETLEALENEAEESKRPVEARAAFRAVGEALGASLQPSTSDVREFDLSAFKRRIAELAEASVSTRARFALAAAIERRLGVSLGLSQKGDEHWDVMRRALTEAAEKAFDTRAEKSLADIERELKSYVPDGASRAQLIRALGGMQVGRAVAFDRQHRRTEIAVQRLHYVYLAGEMSADWSAKELQEEILPHLRRAVDALRRHIGEAVNRARVQAGQPEEPIEELGRREITAAYRGLMLQVIGGLWVDYLTSVEALRTSIGLEAYAQRDPLVAYKSKATEMWNELLANIRSGVVGRALTLRPRVEVQQPAQSARAAQPVAEAANGAEQPANGAAQSAEGERASEGSGGKRRRRRR
ncbi:MAG: preprotein translocase subunit SecA [Anaerolineales bacterium]